MGYFIFAHLSKATWNSYCCLLFCFPFHATTLKDQPHVTPPLWTELERFVRMARHPTLWVREHALAMAESIIGFVIRVHTRNKKTGRPMKILLLFLILFETIELSSLERKPIIEPSIIATCMGKTPCKACKNCSACKHCYVNKGKCGVCKKWMNTVEDFVLPFIEIFKHH